MKAVETYFSTVFPSTRFEGHLNRRKNFFRRFLLLVSRVLTLEKRHFFGIATLSNEHVDININIVFVSPIPIVASKSLFLSMTLAASKILGLYNNNASIPLEC